MEPCKSHFVCGRMTTFILIATENRMPKVRAKEWGQRKMNCFMMSNGLLLSSKWKMDSCDFIASHMHQFMIILKSQGYKLWPLCIFSFLCPNRNKMSSFNALQFR